MNKLPIIELGAYPQSVQPEPLEYTFSDNLDGYQASMEVRGPSGVVVAPSVALDGHTATVTWSSSDFATPGSYWGVIWAAKTGEKRPSALLSWDVKPVTVGAST